MGFILPAVLIFGWLILGSSTLGNDFQQAHITEALNLRFYLALGFEPMWAPHFSGGIPYYGLAMAQAFHFPGWLLSHLPGYFSGQAVVLFALKGILVLIFGHTVTYFSLRRITSLGPLLCYALSFLTIYNLSVLDAFRYGTALDAFVYAQCLILMLLVYLKEGRPLLLIALAVLSQFLMTAGYPPTLPFGALAGLILLFIFNERSSEWLGRFALGALACTVGILLAAPNWVGLFEWLQVNDRRALHSDLAWASFRPLNPIGLISSFYRPWGAEVHAAFGGTSLLGLVFGTVVTLIFQKPKTRWPLLAVLSLPFLYAVGRVSPLFLFFFNHVPLFSTIRVPGRILIIFPLLLVAVTAYLFQKTRDDKSLNQAVGVSAAINGSLLVLSLIYALIFPGLGWFGHDRLEISAESLNTFWTPWSKCAWIVLGLGSSAVFFRIQKDSQKVWGVLIALMLGQSILMLQNGTWIEKRLPSLSLQDFSSRTHLPLYRQEGMLATNSLAESSAGAATVPYSQFIKSADRAANCYLPIDPAVTTLESQAVLIPFYLSNRIQCLSSRSEIFERLKSETCDDTHSLRTWVSSSESSCPKSGSESLVRLNQGNLILALTPNLMEMQTTGTEDSVLVTSFPYVNQNWNVKVDGKVSSVVEVNGAFVGVRVPAGEHRVEVEYFSQPLVLGFRLAMFALLITGAAVIGRARKGVIKVLFLLALMGFSYGYLKWESRFVAKAHSKALLSNNYSDLLGLQLKRWQRHQ